MLMLAITGSGLYFNNSVVTDMLGAIMTKFGPGGPESLESLDDASLPTMIAYSRGGKCVLSTRVDLIAWVDEKVFPTLGFVCDRCEEGFVLDTSRAAEIVRELPEPTANTETPCPLAQYIVGQAAAYGL